MADSTTDNAQQGNGSTNFTDPMQLTKLSAVGGESDGDDGLEDSEPNGIPEEEEEEESSFGDDENTSGLDDGSPQVGEEEDEDDKPQEPDKGDPAQFVDGALDEWDMADDDRRAQIREGFRKAVRLKADDATALKGWQEFEKTVYESPDHAKAMLHGIANELAKHHKVDLELILGGQVEAKTGADGGEGEAAEADDKKEPIFDIDGFVDENDLDETEEAMVRKLNDVFSGAISKLQENLEKVTGELAKANGDLAQKEEAERMSAQLQTAFSQLSARYKTEHNGFDLKKQDFLDAVKARQDLKIEDAVKLHVMDKLLKHQAEAGRRTGARVKPMPQSNGNRSRQQSTKFKTINDLTAVGATHVLED